MIRRLVFAAAVGAAFAGVGTASAADSRNCTGEITVMRGDTLYRIAQRCAVDVPEIVAANPQLPDPNVLNVGDRVRIPGSNGTASGVQQASAATRAAPPRATERTRGPVQRYSVLVGDTLGGLARRFATQPDMLFELNPGLKNRSVMVVGQDIMIPTLYEVTISPTQGPPGTPVEITAKGLPPDTELTIWAGDDPDDAVRVGGMRTDWAGQLHTTVDVPQGVNADRIFFAIVGQEGKVAAPSAPFRITDPDIQTAEIQDAAPAAAVAANIPAAAAGAAAEAASE